MFLVPIVYNSLSGLGAITSYQVLLVLNQPNECCYIQNVLNWRLSYSMQYSQYSAVKGESKVIALGYCGPPISFILMLIVFP